MCIPHSSLPLWGQEIRLRQIQYLRKCSSADSGLLPAPAASVWPRRPDTSRSKSRLDLSVSLAAERRDNPAIWSRRTPLPPRSCQLPWPPRPWLSCSTGQSLYSHKRWQWFWESRCLSEKQQWLWHSRPHRRRRERPTATLNPSHCQQSLWESAAASVSESSRGSWLWCFRSSRLPEPPARDPGPQVWKLPAPPDRNGFGRRKYPARFFCRGHPLHSARRARWHSPVGALLQRAQDCP